MNDDTNEVSSETSDDSSASITEEKTVPLTRFKEVTQKVHKLETEISSLKKQEPSPEQEKELQAKQYLKNLLKETLEEEKKIESEVEAKEQQEFEQQVKDLLDLNPNVKRDEFLEFMEKRGDDFTTVSAAMTAYKELAELKATATEEAKKELRSKPSLPISEGTGGKPDYHEADKGKTFWQVVDDSKQSIKK